MRKGKGLPREPFYVAGFRTQHPGLILQTMIAAGKKGFCILLLLLLGRIEVADGANKVFDFNSDCQRAYQLIIQWKLKEGARMLGEEKRLHPDNLIPDLLENYIDFFTLFFNEDPEDYRRLSGNLEKRLARMNEGPSSSPYWLFCKAVLHFQWAAIKVKFGENWEAGWDFRRAYLQLRENRQKFPSFSPQDCYYGAMEVAVGTIPDGYRWLSHLLGMRGSVHEGMQLLRNFLEKKDGDARLFHQEAVFYYCYLKFYIENDHSAVFDYIRSEAIDIRSQHLFAYLVANLSLNDQRAEKAIQVISNRTRSPEYFQTPVWDFEMAYAKLHHLEPDANHFFERFLSEFRGKFYVKDALQKLSWYYFLSGNKARAEEYRKRILKEGSADAEADRQALREARTGRWPDPLLLRARLLNDGGYYREALRLLQGKKYTDFKRTGDQVEFSYRAGRLFDAEGNPDEALLFYREAIRLGTGRKEYFAARAAWQIGLIYEQKNDCGKAVAWFQRCLHMKGHEYKNSIDQRAKAGIARCKGE